MPNAFAMWVMRCAMVNLCRAEAVVQVDGVLLAKQVVEVRADVLIRHVLCRPAGSVHVDAVMPRRSSSEPLRA